MLNGQVYPFYYVIVKYGLTQTEVATILEECEKLNQRYIIEKQEGFVHFDPLLQRLKQRIPPQVVVKELIQGLKEQHYYPSLMDEFLIILSKNK